MSSWIARHRVVFASALALGAATLASAHAGQRGIVPDVADVAPHVVTPRPAEADEAPAAREATRDAPGTGETLTLDVPGHLPSVAYVPARRERPRPVVVVAHGAADRPEDQCEAWARAFGDRAVLLCTRGRRVPGAPTVFEYISVYELRREAELGLAALADRLGAAVDVREPVYAGFSLGAVLGVHVLAEGKLGAKRAILIEGGADRFTREHTDALAAQGFDRVLFACGETDCPRASRPAADALDRHGMVSRIVIAKGMGHRYGGAMMETIREHLDFVVGDDPRFSP